MLIHLRQTWNSESRIKNPWDEGKIEYQSKTPRELRRASRKGGTNLPKSVKLQTEGGMTVRKTGPDKKNPGKGDRRLDELCCSTLTADNSRLQRVTGQTKKHYLIESGMCHGGSLAGGEKAWGGRNDRGDERQCDEAA